MSPAEAVKRMTVPEGFRVTVFAAEPDLVQPIAMTTDDRGRLWVIESLTYPTWQTNNLPGLDRVVIFEDKDGDGRSDSKRVFLDKGRNLTGIEIGFGGVWLCSAPELIFVPDRNGDDQPDGPPEVALDGWSLEAKHNIVNGLAWGPDGWLYGCHGILSDSKVGRPGTPPAERVVLNCGIWRYHPTKKLAEVVAHGMTNPWGIAFDDHGQLIVANCVIKHLFHVIPGAHYERMYGQDINPYAFDLIKSCADHIHWAGGFWDTEGAERPQNDAFGGGHSHCGAMVYLGDNWPDRYRNGFFTLNVHGHRINHDRLERRGSGYVGKHEPDMLKANDPWFRGVLLLYGPDGGVFMSDWCDGGECHDYDDIHRENGRVYKISYGTPKHMPVDLAKLSDADLVKLQVHKNDWFVSHARRLLQERAARGKLDSQTLASLRRLLLVQTDVTRKLRVIWALHAVGVLESPSELGGRKFLGSRDDWVRAWTIQLVLDDRKVTFGVLEKLIELASKDPSPVVRLALAASLQRPPIDQDVGLHPHVLRMKSQREELRRRMQMPSDDWEYRLYTAEALLKHEEDAHDANLPSMIWYGIEPIISAGDTNLPPAFRAVEADARVLLTEGRIPLVRQLIARRLALRLALDPVADVLADSDDRGLQQDAVRGLFEALDGRRQITMPEEWRRAAAKLDRHPDAEVREKTLLLSVIFGDADAQATLRRRVADAAQSPPARQQALQALVQAKADGLLALLQSLVSDRTLRAVAIRGLAAFDEPATAKVILNDYAKLTSEEKADAINTLVSRPKWAVALLEGVKEGRLSAKDISPFAARQIQALKDARLEPLLAATLGQVRSVSQDKAAQVARYKRLLTPEALKRAEVSHGRALFKRTCGACHKMFDDGGTLAPELTGSGRSDLNYILENVLDPNAVLWNRYAATYFETSDDQLITGIVLQENESTVTIQTQTGTITLPRKDITSRTESKLSMMPEGLLDQLSEQEIVDLVAYLQSPAQVPLKQ
ncbi:MAG: c-type cytochrome [Verrucomicrobia bacterium]|nr:c-type cytochrome [Verrucomicrobiota bacterium]